MKTLKTQSQYSSITQYVFKVISKIVFLLVGILVYTCIGLLSGRFNTGRNGNNDYSIEIVFISFTLFGLLISLALYNYKNIGKYCGWMFVEVGAIDLILITYSACNNLINSAEAFNSISIKFSFIGLAQIIIGVLIVKYSGLIKSRSSNVIEYVENDNDSKLLIGKRIVATLVDYVVFIIFVAITTLIFGEVETTNNPQIIVSKHLSGLSILMDIIFWFIYFPIFESYTGQTMGKAIFGLQVVKENEQLNSFRVALFRRLFDSLEILSLGIVSILLMKFTNDGKRFGDFIAGSRVIREPY